MYPFSGAFLIIDVIIDAAVLADAAR